MERKIIEPLSESGRYDKAVVNAVKDAFNVGIYGRGGTSESGRQPLLLGLPEVEHLKERAAAICAEHPADARAAGEAASGLFSARRGEGRNFRALLNGARLPAGIEGALFGRMVTSDPGSNIEAAVHVAHAFTVHSEESESDYFSVVDDLQGDDEDPGAAHIGDLELTAGLFYGYVVVDVPGLVSNLEGCSPDEWQGADRTLAATVVQHLAHLIATVSPGAKLGSTAPYGYAELMLVEAGSRQPRSLANAYRAPVQPQVEAALGALSAYLGRLDAAYGSREERRVMSIEDCDLPGAARMSLEQIASWAADTVRGGRAG